MTCVFTPVDAASTPTIGCGHFKVLRSDCQLVPALANNNTLGGRNKHRDQRERKNREGVADRNPTRSPAAKLRGLDQDTKPFSERNTCTAIFPICWTIFSTLTELTGIHVKISVVAESGELSR